jgi:hypothetical protein
VVDALTDSVASLNHIYWIRIFRPNAAFRFQEEIAGVYERLIEATQIINFGSRTVKCVL